MTQRKDIVGELRRVVHRHDARQSGMVLAVSGGRDSMALLHAFATLGGVRLAVVTVDHALRTAAQEEAEWVNRTCVERGIACHVVTLTPPDSFSDGKLAWARDARYQALETWRQRLGFGWITTAHHGDDWVETFFMRLLRGSSPHTLWGMSEAQGNRLRPLLGVSRDDIDHYVSKHQIPYVDDPSNDDLTHERVWVRQRLWPMMQQRAGDNLRSRLLTLGGELHEDDALLTQLSEQWSKSPPDSDVLRALATPFKRRVVWSWLLKHVPPDRTKSLQHSHLEAALDLLEGNKREVLLPGGKRLLTIAQLFSAAVSG